MSFDNFYPQEFLKMATRQMTIAAFFVATKSNLSRDWRWRIHLLAFISSWKNHFSVQHFFHQDHINLHFIGQIKRRPVAPSPSDKSPRTVSNGSSSTNGSTSEDHGQDPKYIKTEVAVNRTDSDETEDKSGDASPKPSAPLTSPTSASNVLPKVEQGNWDSQYWTLKKPLLT